MANDAVLREQEIRDKNSANVIEMLKSAKVEIGAVIQTNIEACLCHYKDGELVAITHSNGSNTLFKVEEMKRGEIEKFYETHMPKV